MKQIESSGLGCGMVLITLGVLGLISTFVDLGSSNRAIWVLFDGLADMFGSVTMFSIVTIGTGLILILVVFVLREISAGRAEKMQGQPKYKKTKS